MWPTRNSVLLWLSTLDSIYSKRFKRILHSLNLHSMNWLALETTLQEHQISYFLFSTDCEMARSWLGSCAIFKAKNNIQKMVSQIINWPYVSRKYILHHKKKQTEQNQFALGILVSHKVLKFFRKFGKNIRDRLYLL